MQQLRMSARIIRDSPSPPAPRYDEIRMVAGRPVINPKQHDLLFRLLARPKSPGLDEGMTMEMEDKAVKIVKRNTRQSIAEPTTADEDGHGEFLNEPPDEPDQANVPAHHADATSAQAGAPAYFDAPAYGSLANATVGGQANAPGYGIAAAPAYNIAAHGDQTNAPAYRMPGAATYGNQPNVSAFGFAGAPAHGDETAALAWGTAGDPTYGNRPNISAHGPAGYGNQPNASAHVMTGASAHGVSAAASATADANLVRDLLRTIDSERTAHELERAERERASARERQAVESARVAWTQAADMAAKLKEAYGLAKDEADARMQVIDRCERA